MATKKSTRATSKDPPTPLAARQKVSSILTDDTEGVPVLVGSVPAKLKEFSVPTEDDDMERVREPLGSLMNQLQESTVLTDDELEGLGVPFQSLAMSYFGRSQDRGKSFEHRAIHRNKKLFGRKTNADDIDLYTDVDEIFLKEPDDTEVDEDYRHFFTIATPYLEKDDEHMLYSNPLAPRRFKSQQKLNESTDVKWDADDIVNEEALDKALNKDVRCASRRLIEYEPPEVFGVEAKGQQNPMYRESAIGVEDVNMLTGKKAGRLRPINPPVPQQPNTNSPYGPRGSVPKYVPPGDFLFGKEAYSHYLANKRHLDALEKEEMEPQVNLLRRRLITKRDQIEDAINKAREYYGTSYTPNKSLKERFMRVKKYFTDPEYKGPQTLPQGHSQTDIRARLETLPMYTIWFVYMMVILQGISMSILCAVAGVVAPRLAPQKLVVDDVMTWGGVNTIEHYAPPNMWGGPSRTNLVRSGALYAPCLREDKSHMLRNAIYEAKNSDLGCCEAPGRGAGTATQQECEEIEALFKVSTIRWLNVSCSRRIKGASSGVYVPHDFKPCCLGGKGECVAVSHKHCVILGGTWHISELEHCSQAHCDSDICRVYETNDHMDISISRSQFWRLLLSLVYHEGIILMLLFCFLQVYIGASIERVAGWLRMSGIYIICGFGGLLFGSTLVPYRPNSGSGGVISGFIAVNVVELVQSWPLVHPKVKVVAKMILLAICMFVLGLLPGVNQFTNIGGGSLGLLCALSFMPYIPFSHRHHRVMIVLRICSSLGLVLVISMLFYAFYIPQPTKLGGLRYLNCLAFVDYACDEDLP